MSRFNKCLWLALLAALGVAAVLACGPFFGIEVLPNRKETLLAAPAISFEQELTQLVPAPKDKLPVVEDNEITRASVEAKEPADQRASPAAVQYTAAADSFHKGQLADAKAQFQSVLDLPPDARKPRELWAHFMLGRIAADASSNEQFETTRALVRQGTPDPLGLAVASFGEQARIAWKAGAIAEAVNLYAQQAAYGSKIAQNSLVTIAGLILKDDALLDKAIDDPLTRRLLFICINQNNGPLFFVGMEAEDSPAYATCADRIAAALDRHHLSNIAGAGLLSSAAYHAGRFDLAEKFSASEDVPISNWVRAKLALRRGDTQAALVSYAKALQQPQKPSVLEAETGIVRISRGDYMQALDLFRAAASEASGFFPDYWGDAAYISERVLTIPEFQNYVDTRVPPDANKPVNTELRSILARRLMRATRHQEALRYFDSPAQRIAAQQYINALQKAQSFWHSPSARAEAWFTAAMLARADGMELLGFEREPDFKMWAGSFYDDQTGNKPDTSYQTQDERTRVAASRAVHDVRFQYRLTAVDHAIASANLLPRSSQAFAAVLCEASVWVINRQPKQAAEIYQRYLRQGAYMPWAATFGRACPSPNFEAASSWKLGRRVKRLRKHAKAHPLLAGLLVAGSVLLLLLLLLLAKRKPRPV